MAEITRAATGLSSLSSSKPPSFNSNGFKHSSSSSKHVYDDVFTSPPQRNHKFSAFCSFMDDDYGEIFGSKKSDDGSWVSSSSSVPVFELQPESQQRGRPAKGGGGGGERGIEYLEVFGGFEDDCLALPDGKELFGQLKKKAKTSSSASNSMPRSNEKTVEATLQHISRKFDSSETQCNGSCQTFDNVEHIGQKSNGITGYGATCSSELHDIPGPARQVGEGVPFQKSQTNKSPVKKDDPDLSLEVKWAKKQQKHSRNATTDLGADERKSLHDDCFQKSSCFNVSKSVALSHDSCQNVTVDRPSNIVLDDAKVESTVKGDDSQAGLSEANKKNSEDGAGFQRASGLSGLSSVFTSDDTSHLVGPSYVIMNEAKIATGFDVGKKKRRHSRITSLDLGDHKQACEYDPKLHQKSCLGTSYSFDAPHDSISPHIKVQSSTAMPSSSVPQIFPVESHCKMSETSSCETSLNNLYSGVGDSPPSDEQLDVNSAAAVSVAALQKALREAEKKIRLAKQFLEREGQNPTKLSLKDTLKAKVVKDDKLVSNLSEFQPLSFKDTLKEKIEKKHDENDDVTESQPQKVHEDHVEVPNTIQRHPRQERQCVSATVEFTPVSDGQKLSPEDDSKHEESLKMSKLNEEGDAHEGGVEWEAAKQLNQLISGVKNRIASFMTWQAHTEKNRESKEAEISLYPLQPSEVIEQELKEVDVAEMKEAENNMNASVFASYTDNDESKIGLIREACGPEEDKSTMSKALEQDKAGHNIDLIPDVKRPTGENCPHFTFLGERSHYLPDPEGEKKEDQESREVELEKRKELVLSETEDDCMQGKEEATNEGLDGNCVSQYYGNSNENNDGQMEVVYSTAEYENKEFIHEVESSRRLNVQHGEEPKDSSHHPENISERNEQDAKLEKCEVQEEAEDQQRAAVNSDCPGNIIEIIENDEEVLKEATLQDDIRLFEEGNLVGEIGKVVEVPGEPYEWHENERDQGILDPVKDMAGAIPGWGENQSQSQRNHTGEAAEHVSCITADAECDLNEKVFLVNDEKACQSSWGNPGMEEAVFPNEESNMALDISYSSSEPIMDMESPVLPDQQNGKIMEIPSPSSEPEMDYENPVLTHKGSELIGEERVSIPASAENSLQFNDIECHECANIIFPCETPILKDSETDAKCMEKDINRELMESKSEDILKNQNDHLHASGKTLNVKEVASVSDQQGEKRSVDAVQRRRRWFENGDETAAAMRPNILEGQTINLKTAQEVLEECELAATVEIHTIEIDSKTTEVSNARETNTALNHEDHKVNIQGVQKRRRWFANKGEEEVSEPLNLFEGIKVALEMGPGIVNESQPHNMSDNCKLSTEGRYSQRVPEADVVTNDLKDEHTVEAAPRRKRWFENGETVGLAQLRMDEEAVMAEEINQECRARGNKHKCGNLGDAPILQDKDGTQKIEPVNELHIDPDAVNRKEKERIAVERAIREARERAFAEVRERAKRDAVERPKAEVHQRVGGVAQDSTGKVSTEASSSSDRALLEAKLRAERAAVERATAEARERALQKALFEKAAYISKEQDPKFYSSSSDSRSSYPSNKGEKFDGADGESPQRHKARLERQKRTMERAAKALEEKNKRDLLAQQEQTTRDMWAVSMDAEVNRWSCGKEGNLRALLSTLQYILGPDSGWPAVSLTDLVAPTAVRKAYKRANLCVHPDKLQQRGATIQQKYICEKVFDLLKEAWSKFNPDER